MRKLKKKTILRCLNCHWEGPVSKLKPLTDFLGDPPERLLCCPNCETVNFEVNEKERG